ncbi:selenium metabolism-associated LysR family transcriptional regulator [Salsuginibacillus kocurii]|uniref:selenium metabolism-associated LysR family transcriptional regulator n=1 Tax=Salsuginibacillus kocurii TaxID=427078 RepID=UPI00035FA808|nr:selenium metabolism-associated LysR family transcriptional regulator [Salsuginibacillus kocurii]
MDFKRLRTFVTVVEVGSVSKASDLLQITQPAVSKQIKTLEQTIGSSLLDRTTLQLTQEGELVYEKAVELLREWDGLLKEAGNQETAWRRPFRLGASSIPGTYVLPGVCKSLHDQFPHSWLDLQVGSSKEIDQKLLANEIDAAMIGTKPESETVQSVELWSDRIAIIGPRSTKEPAVSSFEDLQGLPFIKRDEHSGTAGAASTGLAEWNGSINDLETIATVPSTSAAISLVEAGVGYTLVSETAVLADTNRLYYVAGWLPATRTFYLAYHAKHQYHPAMEHLFVLIEQGDIARLRFG